MPRARPRSAPWWVWIGLQAAALLPAAAWAQEGEGAWLLTPRLEYSDVTINANEGSWRSASLALERRLGDGRSVFAVVQRQQRNDAVDTGLQLGGYARLGGWNAMATVETNPAATFLPDWTYEVQLDHGIGRARRAGLGYRRLHYGSSEIALWSPQVTFYRGNDEFGVSYRIGRNDVLDHDIRVLQLRALAVRGKNRAGVYVARGDYIFDALGIGSTSGSGWSANVTFARSISKSAWLQIELGQGMESDTFRQRSMAISLRVAP